MSYDELTDDRIVHLMREGDVVALGDALLAARKRIAELEETPTSEQVSEACARLIVSRMGDGPAGKLIGPGLADHIRAGEWREYLETK